MINGLKPLDRTLRWGMVGGGGSSQIGYIHRFWQMGLNAAAETRA